MTSRNEPPPTIAVLGASGMIGGQIAADLMRSGWSVTPVARRFTRGQRHAFGEAAVECPFVSFEALALERLLAGADIVVNCVGVLQDGGGDRAIEAHEGFVQRLLDAVGDRPEKALVVHVSIPGEPADDGTSFSRTKRSADRLIEASGVPYVVLRPGFVVSPVAYGGGALLRAIAASPFSVSPHVAAKPFATVDIGDVCATVDFAVRGWRAGRTDWASTWDLAASPPSTVGDVIVALRAWLGGPRPVGYAPTWLMEAGAKVGDIAGHLGWRPPIRTTALRELWRGVVADPGPWIAATGVEPRSLAQALERLPATIQEKWFARLFLLKAAILAVLAAFWIVSGVVALTAGFGPASDILTSHGLPPLFARPFTVVTGLADIAIGMAISFRRTCGAALLAGIVLSLGYLLAAVVVAPDLWLDPLGPLVKVAPVVILMAVALAVLEDR